MTGMLSQLLNAHLNYANKWHPPVSIHMSTLFHAEESNDLSSGDRINFNLHGVFWLTPGFVEGKTVRRKTSMAAHGNFSSQGGGTPIETKGSSKINKNESAGYR